MTSRCLLPVAGLALLLASACGSSSSPRSASHPSPTTSGVALSTHTDDAFSIEYPTSWTYKEGTGPYGIYNDFLGPKGASGYEPSIQVGRTVHADAQAYADGMTLFETIHKDRTLDKPQAITVTGAVKADLIKSTRPFKGLTITAWNVFVLTPSNVALNVEFAAPSKEFDTAQMQELLSSMVAR